MNPVIFTVQEPILFQLHSWENKYNRTKKKPPAKQETQRFYSTLQPFQIIRNLLFQITRPGKSLLPKSFIESAPPVPPPSPNFPSNFFFTPNQRKTDEITQSGLGASQPGHAILRLAPTSSAG